MIVLKKRVRVSRHIRSTKNRILLNPVRYRTIKKTVSFQEMLVLLNQGYSFK